MNREFAAPPFTVRPARADDAPALLAILDAIVRIGGTTAVEEPLDEPTFRAWFMEGDGHVACFVAVDDADVPLGYQSLRRDAALPPGCVDIATYARPEPKVPGVGRALFASTLSHARERGLSEINATIRADNAGGLAYYTAMGFVDHAVKTAVPLRDGTPVDRLSKRYAVG